MRGRRLKAGTVAAGLLVLASVGADAACLRRIVNRSATVLVASQDGGPRLVLPPGTARTLRMDAPGRLALSASCPASATRREARPVAEATLAYGVTLDRCAFALGSGFFDDALGRGFFATPGTAPFAVNTPRQGDVVLGPFADGCGAPD